MNNYSYDHKIEEQIQKKNTFVLSEDIFSNSFLKFFNIKEIIMVLMLICKKFNNDVICSKIYQIFKKSINQYHDLLEKIEMNFDTKKILKTINGFLALEEGLLTIEQIKIFHADSLKAILSDYGLIALKEKYITIENVKMLNPHVLETVLTDLGIAALRKGFITMREIKKIEISTLKSLLTQNGLIAMQKKWITIKQAILYAEYLKPLFTDSGLVALQDRWVTVEDARTFSVNSLRILLTPQGLTALRQWWITLGQARTLDECILKLLLSDNGLTALRKKWIKIDQAKALDVHVVTTFLSDTTLMTWSGLNQELFSKELQITLSIISKQKTIIVSGKRRTFSSNPIILLPASTPNSSWNSFSSLSTSPHFMNLKK